MAHVKVLANEEAGPEAGRTLEQLARALGTVPSIFRVMAHVPDLLDGVLRIDRATTRSLPKQYRELAYLTASLLNQCAY
jgi:alkylhydroperoxidase family enzyme